MTRIGPFEQYPMKYENWFDANKFAYQSELAAVKQIIPLNGEGIEIGVGSGRFAEPLCVKFGVEPSEKMARLAFQREIQVIGGIAEELPIRNEAFDFVLIITAICFVDDLEKTFIEIHRILRTKGCIIVGFVDKHSLLGKAYQEHKNESVFYREANFFPVDEVVSYLIRAEFHHFSFYQTVFKPLKNMKRIAPSKKGYGEGSFVVIKGEK